VTIAACNHPSSSSGGDDDASTDAPVVTGDGSIDDGSATRQACTSQFGDGLSQTPTFGRLDGYLVAIVAPSSMQACNDDDSHVHLQIRMQGMIYDIAIDVTDEDTGVDDVHTTTRDDIAMPGTTPWTEGWHTSTDLLTDYVSLGLHDTDLTLEAKADMVTTLQTDLATANHVSIYTTSYNAKGAHLVHRNGSGHDGLLVTNPLTTPPHIRFFSFSDQSF
jgi:hypothetical protein